MPRPRIHDSEIKNLYLGGLSIRQVAKELGLSETWVAVLVKRFGISRDKSRAAQLRQPSISKRWRSSRQAARKAYERYYGVKLKSDEHVHHINHDYTDNRIENLTVLMASEHSKHHHPRNPIPRWLRPERISYIREYLKNWRRRRKDASKIQA